MSRFPEFYSGQDDQSSREQEYVYIGDLLLSSAMVALQSCSAPRGSGFIDAQPVLPGAVNEIHIDLVDAIRTVIEQDDSLARCINNLDVLVERNAEGQLEVSAEYWKGRPLKITFVAGLAFDPDLLTGFMPFNPDIFDSYQEPGLAQRVIDSLRLSGDPMKIEASERQLPDAYLCGRVRHKTAAGRQITVLPESLERSPQQIAQINNQRAARSVLEFSFANYSTIVQ